MKKLFTLFMALVAIFFASCEKEKGEKDNGDVLKGTWKNAADTRLDPAIRSLTYIFDGNGNYKYIHDAADGEMVYNGTYVIEENSTIVRLY